MHRLCSITTTTNINESLGYLESLCAKVLMYLRELRLRAFRNYSELGFLPGSGINVLVGDNAQGKSNLLEAIYLLATTRSLRANRESEMIMGQEEAATVWADLSREKET